MSEDTGITVRFDAATYAAVKREAADRRMPLAEVVRRAVVEHLSAEGSVTEALRRAVDTALEPHVRRLAALCSKAVLQAAMSKWLVAAAIEVLPDPGSAKIAYRDQDRLLEDARKFAVEDLRARRRGEPVTEAEAEAMAAVVEAPRGETP